MTDNLQKNQGNAALPKAWAVFAPNGNMRLWSSDCEEVRKFAEGVRMPVVPLFEQPNEYAMTTLWLGAFRYYCGRMTYAVSDFCSLLIGHWPNLPEKTKALIHRDLEEEFKRDDEARADSQQWKPLGNDCDRQHWERVRQLWEPNVEPSRPREAG